MYLWIVRLATWMPSFNSSPRMRSAPQSRFSKAMRRMSWMVAGTRRGPGRRQLDRQHQKSRNPCRCHLSTVSGLTSSTASRHRGTNPASRTSRPRSCGRKAGRFTLREATISCWRRRAFSATSSPRDRVRSLAIPATSGRDRMAPQKADLTRSTTAVAAARTRRRNLDSTGGDLAQHRRRHKLATSGILNDRAVAQDSSQHNWTAPSVVRLNPQQPTSVA
jgi:hypothetical protein